MTSVESAPPQQAAPAATGGPRRPSPWSPRGILLGVYRLFHNNKFGLALILLLAVMALAGVIFPQVTAEFRADPEAYEAWLEERRASYGGWTTVLSLVGAFSMFSSVPFAAVTILLVLSIVACTVHRMPQLWRNATAPRRQVGEGFFEHARLRDTVEVPLPPEQATERARALLEEMRFRVLDVDDDCRCPGREPAKEP